MYLLLLILLFAAVSDLSLGRIPNYVTLGGIVLSQMRLYYTGCIVDAVYSLAGAILVALIVFPLFAIGCLGGGDIKLLMVLPAFFGLPNSFRIIWMSFVVAAVVGSAKLMISGNLRVRIFCFLRWLGRCMKTGKPTRYDTFTSDGSGKLAVNRIHFSLPILVGTIVFWVQNYIQTKGGI